MSCFDEVQRIDAIRLKALKVTASATPASVLAADAYLGLAIVEIKRIGERAEEGSFTKTLANITGKDLYRERLRFGPNGDRRW